MSFNDLPLIAYAPIGMKSYQYSLAKQLADLEFLLHSNDVFKDLILKLNVLKMNLKAKDRQYQQKFEKRYAPVSSQK